MRNSCSGRRGVAGGEAEARAGLGPERATHAHSNLLRGEAGVDTNLPQGEGGVDTINKEKDSNVVKNFVKIYCEYKIYYYIKTINQIT